jgi:hypothetical protein
MPIKNGRWNSRIEVIMVQVNEFITMNVLQILDFRFLRVCSFIKDSKPLDNPKSKIKIQKLSHQSAI